MLGKRGVTRVLPQFGYVHTIPRHPYQYASSTMTRQEVVTHYLQYLNYVLFTENFSLATVTGVENI